MKNLYGQLLYEQLNFEKLFYEQLNFEKLLYEQLNFFFEAKLSPHVIIGRYALPNI